MLSLTTFTASFSLRAAQQNSRGLRMRRLGLMLPGWEYFCCLLRAVCCKDQLRSCNIEKTDFPKLCQNKALGELVLKIQVSGRLDFYIFLGNFFCILRSQRPKLTPKLGIFWKLPFTK